MKTWKKSAAIVLALIMAAGSLTGCGGNKAKENSSNTGKNSTEDTAGKTSFVFGDTTFNPENEEADVNPHNTYAGWACIRYGIGETLFHYSDSMEIEPWLAESYENPDELTWVIQLRDDVTFSSGRKLDAEAVKECLEHLVAVHERAKGDLLIDSITADGQTLTRCV